MRNLSFADLTDYLKHGREIEFAYNGRQYSITNHLGSGICVMILTIFCCTRFAGLKKRIFW